MDVTAHCEHLEAEGTALASLAGATASARTTDRTVTTCPDWDLAELFRHVGGLYRWSEWLVREHIGKETWRASLPIEYPDELDDYERWMRAGLDDALATFGAADPTARVWAWGGDQRARFWPRRMLFETVVHRRDAEITVDGAPSPIEGAVAVDGVDEFFELLPHTARWNRAVADLRVEERWSIGFAATDTGDAWRARINATGLWWDRAGGDTDARVEATVSDLLLWLAGRDTGRVTTTGDEAAAQRWRAATKF